MIFIVAVIHLVFFDLVVVQTSYFLHWLVLALEVVGPLQTVNFWVVGVLVLCLTFFGSIILTTLTVVCFLVVIAGLTFFIAGRSFGVAGGSTSKKSLDLTRLLAATVQVFLDQRHRTKARRFLKHVQNFFCQLHVHVH